MTDRPERHPPAEAAPPTAGDTDGRDDVDDHVGDELDDEGPIVPRRRGPVPTARPGWYRAPGHEAWLRWWDGRDWTDDWHPLPADPGRHPQAFNPPPPRQPPPGPGRPGGGPGRGPVASWTSGAPHHAGPAGVARPSAEDADGWGPGFGFLAVGVLIAAQLVIGFAGGVWGVITDPEGATTSDFVVVVGFVAEIVAAAALLALLRWRTAGWRGVLGGGAARLERARRWLAHAAIGAGTGVAAVFGVGLFVAAASALLGVDQTQEPPQQLLEDVDAIAGLALVAGVLLIVVLAPLAEELAFRRTLYPGLRRRWGVWPGILVSGLVFGAIHVELLASGLVGAVSMASLALVGMLLAYLYERTGTIVAPIAAHAAFNGVAVAATLLVN